MNSEYGRKSPQDLKDQARRQMLMAEKAEPCVTVTESNWKALVAAQHTQIEMLKDILDALGLLATEHERSDDASGAVQQRVGKEYQRFSAGDERHLNESPEGFETSGTRFGTVDEYGGEGYCLTGWENERRIFEAFILGEGISYYSDETPDVNLADTVSHTDNYDAALGYLVADLTDIIDEDRPIEDCTTIHYPKERRKHQQSGGPMMGGM